MIRPRKTLADVAPRQEPTMGLPSFAGMGGPIEQMPVSTLGDVAALAPGKKGVFGSGIGIGELLVHGLNGYLAGRGNPVGAANMNMISEARENEQQMQFDRERFNRELEARRDEKMRPRLEQVGNAIGMVDPATGQFTPTYTGPEEQTSLQQNIAYLREVKPDITDEEIAEIVRQNITQPQFPRIITYSQGDQTVTEELNPDGTRKPVAKAPRWAPKPPSASSSAPPAGFILD